MTRQGQIDQLIQERSIGEARSLPQLRIHADGGEAGYRVDFVEVHLAGLTIHQKVHPCHARTVDRPVGPDRKVLNVLRRGPVQRRRHEQLRGTGALINILGRVIIELAARNDLTGYGGARLLIPQHAHLDLARRRDSPFHQDPPIISRRLADARSKLIAIVTLRNTHAGPQIRRLCKDRVAQPRLDLIHKQLGLDLPTAPGRPDVVGDWKTMGPHHILKRDLVHRQGRAQDPCPHVRDARQL